jgi:hypothetical protein
MRKCKVTKANLRPFMSFGKMPMANGFLKKNDFKNEKFYDLDVGFNEKISLFQILDIPKFTNTIYKNYPFFTHKSKYMIDHFKKCAQWLEKKFLDHDSNLIEIGSNDGTMIKNFNNSKINAIGIDPAPNVASLAKKNGVDTINMFFNYKNIKKLKKYKNNTKVIYAANVFCHIKDLIDVIKCVDYLLSSDGYFIFEEPYLGSMYKNISYDQLYDEHIYMFSITSILKIFEMYDFELQDAVTQNTHGGSIRYIIMRKNKGLIKKSISNFLKYEDKNNISNINGCFNFKKNCEISRENTLIKIKNLKKKNKTICGYAATAKSTTVLNYCGIGSDLIDCIFDTSENKIGKFSPGMHIPIVTMADFKKNYFDYAYLFAWNHKKEIYEKENKFTKNGFKWLSHVKI